MWDECPYCHGCLRTPQSHDSHSPDCPVTLKRNVDNAPILGSEHETVLPYGPVPSCSSQPSIRSEGAPNRWPTLPDRESLIIYVSDEPTATSEQLEPPIRHDASPPEDGQLESEERDDYTPLPCDRQSSPPAITSGVASRGVHRQDFSPEIAWEEDSIRQGQGYEASGSLPVVLGPQSHRRLYDAQKAAQNGGHCDETRAKAKERSSDAGIEQLLQILESVRERLERSSQEAREIERGVEGEIEVLKEEQEELREEMKKLARKVEEGDRALKRKEEELAYWQDVNQTAERQVEEHKQAQSSLKEEMWSLLEDGE